MKLPKILETLQGDKTGIPQTGFINKNRSVLIIYDREKADNGPWEYYVEFKEQIEDALSDLDKGVIDSITIDAKERTW
jgi:hypothetical protein